MRTPETPEYEEKLLNLVNSTKPRLVNRVVFKLETETFTLESPLAAFMSPRIDARDRIPKEYRPRAVVRICANGSDDCGDSELTLTVDYDSPVSEEQHIADCRAILENKALSERLRKDCRRRLYEELKAEFEGGAK